MKQRFTEFLEKKGVQAEYNENIKNDAHGMEPYAPLSYVSSAFEWYDTPQKEGFWLKINSEWLSICQRAML